MINYTIKLWNRRVSATLSPILYLFLAPSGKLYLKVQNLLALDEVPDASPPPIVGNRRPGPKHPNYGIPAEHWPTVVHRVVEQKEPLRTVAACTGYLGHPFKNMRFENDNYLPPLLANKGR